ncbi:Urease accessory protein UreF [Pseudooceanicola batsensis HTCC2597]|uniref:Urease accessory protein UreF n=1 Tax=Pseudooceanicola batsensis (strain ATCC BAA-863 / DSM 15984 / KCTC 12145 / HTCC2597) TaxID=252305 RepID=A3TTP2_PSEBH|nr:urease accessory UreF family protein [Pseudooceanicola batsensis]EAQ05019.1 Urease accessory protein UreF [Pseudooceanicola batsensis HTCC2597]
MTPPDPVLLLHQWLSPAFPVGAFAWSHGIEAAMAQGDIRDRESAQDWIATALEHGSGRSDAVLVAAAWRSTGPADLAALAELACALSPGAERLAETRGMGAAFARAVRELHHFDLPDAPYPVAFGRAARLAGAPLPLVLSLFLQAFVANLVSAAVRLVPLGQTDGQRITLGLAPLIRGMAERAEPGDTDRIGSAALRVDLASMAHETLPTRLFQS